MKIIIIILICLFFSLTIIPINEFITNPITDTQIPTTGTPPQTQTTETAPVELKTQSDGGLQTQINILSTSIKTTNSIAVEAKNKVDEISSQIKQLKEALTKEQNFN